MRFLFITILLFSFAFKDINICPPKGDSPKVKLQLLDSLKNRISSKEEINSDITLDYILMHGDDSKRFTQKELVTITGYVFMVKYGGAETCNCHATDKTQLDIHIEIVKDLANSDGTKRMIVEINRYTRASDKSMDYEAVKKLIGKKVTITGLLFADIEHKQNSYNITPCGTNLWRATIWEIHPCLSIKVL